MIQITEDPFSEIELKINIYRSSPIVIPNGYKEVNEVIKISNTEMSIREHDKIKYLGCYFSNKLLFEKNEIMTKCNFWFINFF